MINKTEFEERKHLEKVKFKLTNALQQLDSRVKQYATEIQEQKNYLWENRSDMDHAEKVSTRQSAQQLILDGESILSIKNRIKKLVQIPYFGRFDFVKNNDNEKVLPVYIGIHSFVDETNNENLIFDWRAPISSIFYDFELGQAKFKSPSGEISGEVLLKRQFRIRNGDMEYMLESGINIIDDVLQKELSRTSDDKMKNIVATIQRDQNTIIRNEDAQTLIIQGVAGSGKTSIALHRIAFLLYKLKDHLTAKDILIISPNKVFSNFISNVLPELGEEPISEKNMEEIANEILNFEYDFQSFFEQIEQLLENNDKQIRNRIHQKSNLEFIRKLDEYIDYVKKSRFTPHDLLIRNHLITSNIIERSYKKRNSMPINQRLKWIAEDVEQEVYREFKIEITSKEKNELKSTIRKMFKQSTLLSAYKKFFVWMKKPELIKLGKKSKLEYSDIFPLIYLKLSLEDKNFSYRKVKHLLIDEMQDYTLIQYAVLSKLFSCEKTILGDENQSINPQSSSSSETINCIFKMSDRVKLHKSYRSTYEITKFAQRILPNSDLIAIERHGEEPQVLFCKNQNEELSQVFHIIHDFLKSEYHTMGIICKTKKQAEKLYNLVKKQIPQTSLYTEKSTSFKEGISVCPVYLSKGLEFDQVHVLDASSENYSTHEERYLLYIACTRAIHRLTLTSVGQTTPYITKKD